MNYQIEITAEARQEIRQLSGYVRAIALNIIADLAHDPRPPSAQPLRAKSGIYRVWLAGRWRIAYAVDDEQKVVLILRVRRKEQIDYESLSVPEPEDE